MLTGGRSSLDEVMNDPPPKRIPGKPYRPGESGNRAGRSKGALNEADILKRYLSKRVGKGDRKTTVLNEIIRQQYQRAEIGEYAAQKLIFDLRDKLGYGQEVSSEQRERQLMHWPRSLYEDEYKFKISAAHELERQSCKAILDGEDPEGRHVPDLTLSGDEAVQHGQYDAALDFYLRQARSAEPIAPDPDPTSPEALSDRQRAEVVGGNDPHYQAIARIGLLADRWLWSAQYALCIKCADAAVATIAKRDITWVKLIRAHALMFSGQTEEARSFYCAFNSNRAVVVTHWEMQILRDFAKFREAGRSAPLMLDIETRLSEAGWRADGVSDRARATPKEMSEDDRNYIRLNPDTDQAATIFKNNAMLDEAFNIHRRRAEKARFALTQQTDETRAREQLGRAELSIAELARNALMAGKFGLGLECLRELSAQTRARLSVQAVHAHLLLLTRDVPAAEEIYHHNRGKFVGGRPWSLVIWDDLRDIRAKGLSTPASKRLEEFFEEHQDAAARGPSHESLPTPDLSYLAGPSAPNLSPQATPTGTDPAEIELVRLRAICDRLGPKLHDLIRATGRERDDLQEAVDAVADFAFLTLCDGQPAAALEACLEALEASPNAPWPLLRRAHVLAALGQDAEARILYRRFLTGKAASNRTWPSVLRDEFGRMREYSIDPPIFAEIERELVDAQNRLGIGSVQR